MKTVAMLPTAILVLLAAASAFVLGDGVDLDITCGDDYEVGSDGECHAVFVHDTQGDGTHVMPSAYQSQTPYSSRVTVWINKESGAFTGCGGTLVNWNAVLTAAHCANEATDGWVEPGIYDTVTFPFGSPTFQGENVHLPDNYEIAEANTHDMALIILDSVPTAEEDGAEIFPWTIRATVLDEVIYPVYAMHHAYAYDTVVEIGPGTMTVISVSDESVPTLGRVSHDLSDVWGGWSGSPIFDENFQVAGVLTSGSAGQQFDCDTTLWLYNLMVDNKLESFENPTYSEDCDIVPV